MLEIMSLGLVNCYLLAGENRSVLVDTGAAGRRSFVYEKVKNRNVSLIVLTHGHADHMENAEYLSERLGAPIAMHEADFDLAQDNSIRPLYADTILGRFIKFMSSRMLKKFKFAPSDPVFLSENDRLDKYGVKARIVELPGHTKGSVGILTDDRKLITGDAMFSLVRPYRSRLYEDKNAMLKSAEKIKNLGVDIIYPGHGKPFDSKKIMAWKLNN